MYILIFNEHFVQYCIVIVTQISETNNDYRII